MYSGRNLEFSYYGCYSIQVSFSQEFDSWRDPFYRHICETLSCRKSRRITRHFPPRLETEYPLNYFISAIWTLGNPTLFSSTRDCNPSVQQAYVGITLSPHLKSLCPGNPFLLRRPPVPSQIDFTQLIYNKEIVSAAPKITFISILRSLFIHFKMFPYSSLSIPISGPTTWPFTSLPHNSHSSFIFTPKQNPHSLVQTSRAIYLNPEFYDPFK